MSRPYVLSRDAIMLLLSHDEFLPPGSGSQKVNDAVAVAGLFAAGTASPRAVLLALGTDSGHLGIDSPAEVRDYLEKINVPLFVWRTVESEYNGEWGAAAEVFGASAANAAKKTILRYLERQRIVWLEGSHLPNEVELIPAADGIEIARRVSPNSS